MLNKIKQNIKNKAGKIRVTGNITVEEMKEKVNKGAILVDVRSSQEFNEGHLNGAINIPDFEVGTKSKIMLPNKKQVIVLYCKNGGRSKRACEKLKELGYENVFNVQGGLENL